jgi:predicted AlkP superfamily phosphohydrolase/phosphomutase
MVKTIKRLMFLGLDGGMPYFIEKFSKEGEIPNIIRLISEGFYSEMLPYPPCDTPTNWASLATGATTGTHGATSFWVHLPGEALGLGQHLTGRTSLSEYTKSEFIWDVAARHRIKPLVLNYPSGWPTKDERVMMIASIFSNAPPCQLARPTIFFASKHQSDVERASEKEGRVLTNDLIKTKIVLAKKWIGLPPSFHSCLEVRLKFNNIIQAVKPFVLYTLLFDPDGKGYSKALFCTKRDYNTCLATLNIGEKSDWLTFHTDLLISHPYIKPLSKFDASKLRVKAIFKITFEEFDLKGLKVSFRTGPIYSTSGWVQPESLAKEIIEHNLFLSPRNSKNQAVRLVSLAQYIQETRGWDLLYMHFHIGDSLNHRFMARTCSDSPDYEENDALEAMEGYRKGYQLMDHMVGEFLQKFGNKETLTIVASDHAALPHYKCVRMEKVFAEAGLLVYKKRAEKGKLVVDWSKTKAFPYSLPTWVWVNLKGRELEGIVEPGEEYDEVCEEIIRVLQSIRDPDTGASPISFITKKEFSPLLGLRGDRVGDVIYFVAPPFGVWDGSISDLVHDVIDSKRLNQPAIVPMKRWTADHNHLTPTARHGNYTVSGILILKGPGIKSSVKGKKVVRTTDVVPTASHLFKLPMPSDSEGRILWEALE